MREAQCPHCNGWSEVTWDDTLPPGGWWWAVRGGGCPRCGEIVLVESEATGWRDWEEVEP